MHILADEHAAFANRAARLCKRAALHDRAEVWYQRGIGLARRSKDDVEYISAWLGNGGMLAELGDEEHGKAHLLKAARAERDPAQLAELARLIQRRLGEPGAP